MLKHATVMAQLLQMKVTLAHISDDYREMNYIPDSMLNNAVSEEVIKARALFSELADAVSLPMATRELVTMRRFEDVEKCIEELEIDLVIAGHITALWACSPPAQSNISNI